MHNAYCVMCYVNPTPDMHTRGTIYEHNMHTNSICRHNMQIQCGCTICTNMNIHPIAHYMDTHHTHTQYIQMYKMYIHSTASCTARDLHTQKANMIYMAIKNVQYILCRCKSTRTCTKIYLKVKHRV